MKTATAAPYDYWEEMRSIAGEKLAAIVELAHASTNYDHPNPYALFLDLIGYSREEYGANLFDYSKLDERIGCFELDLIADALKVYAIRPISVYDFIGKMLDRERETLEP